MYWNFVKGPGKYWNINLFCCGFSTMFIFGMVLNYCQLIIIIMAGMAVV